MKILYAPVEQKEYKNGKMSAGLVRNSPHKVNKIYLNITGDYIHLREDEAYAIISCLSQALWTEYFIRNNKSKISWKTFDELKEEDMEKEYYKHL